MRRTVTRLFPITALLLAGGLALVLTPAQAVHQCGAQHKQSDGHDDDWDGRGNRGGGCKTVRETDFLDGDTRIDAPELAARGDFKVGVRTVKVVNRDQIDILNRTAEDPFPTYDRPLTLEVWYPTKLYNRRKQLTTYHDVLGSGPDDPARPLRPFEFAGRATRGGRPNLDGGPYPLVIVSHGYPGSRVLMTYLTENLASKGYVVVAIDHTESTHADKVGFQSTLLNRTLDINFVIDQMAQKSAAGRGFLAGMVDADRSTVIGYSMGGYGVMNAAGAGYNPASILWGFFGMNDLIARLAEGSSDYAALLDPRIQAMVAFAPWGGDFGVFTASALAGIQVPTLFIAGKQDQTSGYPNIEWFFENAINSDRYLLAYESAIHEVAVNPAPPLAGLHYREFIHYQEPGWDNRRLNNINQHFITAFIGKYVRGDAAQYGPFLDLIEPVSNDSPRADETDPRYWTGFPNYSAIGMEFRHLTP